MPLIISQPFRLLDLPPEIWSKIGRLVVDGAAICTQDTITKAKRPAITRTCLVLRNELLPYFYRTKVRICVCLLGSKMKIIGKWLRSIDVMRRSSVKVLTVWIMDEHLRGKGDRQGRGRIESVTSCVREKWKLEMSMEIETEEGPGSWYKVILH